MPLEPTEREEHFFKAMVDAADGSTPEELEPTERKEHWYKEIIDAIKSGGGGSGGGPLLVTISIDEQAGALVLDKTWQEIYDAKYAVFIVTGNMAEHEGYEIAGTFQGVYAIGVGTPLEKHVVKVNLTLGEPTDANFETATPDGYPSFIPTGE